MPIYVYYCENISILDLHQFYFLPEHFLIKHLYYNLLGQVSKDRNFIQYVISLMWTIMAGVGESVRMKDFRLALFSPFSYINTIATVWLPFIQPIQL